MGAGSGRAGAGRAWTGWMNDRVGAGRVLVVDDDRITRALLTRGVEQAGHVVQTAENGRDALDLLRDGPYDVVLLDIVDARAGRRRGVGADQGRSPASTRSRDHDLRGRRDRQRGPMHRDGGGGLSAEALRSRHLASADQRGPGAEAPTRDRARARAERLLPIRARARRGGCARADRRGPAARGQSRRRHGDVHRHQGLHGFQRGGRAPHR